MFFHRLLCGATGDLPGTLIMNPKIMNFSSIISRYLAASPLPAATGLFSTAVAVFLTAWGINLLRDNHPMECFALFVMSLGWAGLAGFALADSLSRYREYLRMRSMFRRW